MKKKNEIHAIESSINLYLKYYSIHCPIRKIFYPDEETRDKNEIDCVFYIGKEKIALEHSIIEHYEGQIEYTNNSYYLIAAINKRLESNLPNDRYYVALVQPALIIGKRKSFLSKLSEVIFSEMLTHIQTLKINESFTIKYDNLDITIFCENGEGPQKGMLHRAPTIPKENIELQIQKRIKRLLRTKISKLIKYKIRGYKTILAIEDISGMYMGGIRRDMLSWIEKIYVQLFVDTGIVFASYNEKMIVGNIWKDKTKWYQEIPMVNRLEIDRSK